MSRVPEINTSPALAFDKSPLNNNEEMLDLLAEIGKIVQEIIESLSRSFSPSLNNLPSSRPSSPSSSPLTTRVNPIPTEVISPRTTEEKRESLSLQVVRINQTTKALGTDLTKKLDQPPSPSLESGNKADIDRMEWLLDETLKIEAEMNQMSRSPTPELLDLTGVDLRPNAEKIREREDLDRLNAQLTHSNFSSKNLTALREEVSQLQNSRDSEFDTIQLANKIMKLAKLLLDEEIIDSYRYPTFHKWLSATKQMIAIRKEVGELELQLIVCMQELRDQPRPFTYEQALALTVASAARTSLHLISCQAEEALQSAVERLKELAQILPSPN